MATATAAPAETTTDQETEPAEDTRTWSDRARDVYAQKREAALNKARNEAIRARQDMRNTWFRNRRQIAPWKLTAATAAAGGLGAAAEHAEIVTTLAACGGTGLAAAGAAAGAWWWFREGIARKWWRRFEFGLGAGVAWSALAPLAETPEHWAGLGLGLLGGTVGLASRYWQHHRPGYPDPPREHEQPDPDSDSDSQETVVEVTESDIVMDRFVRYVTQGRKAALPGATISNPRVTDYGLAFDLALVPGEQDIDTARDAVGKIASAIDRYDKSVYTFVQGTTVTSVEMRITIGDPMGSSLYAGPRIVVDGGDVYIEVGPYQDGEGYERFHVLSGQDTIDAPAGSVHGGFLLGSKNSGKSRVFELLAIGLRQIGIQVWWLDPQNGASSKALRDHADWPLMGEHGGNRMFGNARDLLSALQGVRDIRNAEQGHRGETGFVHTPQRPAIMVLIDECHKVFNEKNPDTGTKFGVEFGELDRETRKLGIAFIGGSQLFTMDTFGNSGALRSGMTTGNLLVLRMTEKSHCGLLPGHSPSPFDIPTGGGYGYNPEGERPQALWRAEHVTNATEWLGSLPTVELDQRSAKAAGDAYLRRHEEASRQAEATGDLLDAFDEATDGAAAAALLRRHRKGSEEGKEGSSSSSAVSGRVPARPTLSVVPGPAPDGVPKRDLKPREQELMNLLDDYEELSVAQLAEEMDVSEVTVRKTINSLGETHLAQVRRGVYRRA